MWDIREWSKRAEEYLRTVARNLSDEEPGMGREVFAIGGDKVVKIAFNQFGREQNQREELYYDWYGKTGLVLPVFASAEDSRWIVMAKARKMATMKDLWGMFGTAPMTIIDALNGDEWSLEEIKKNRVAMAVYNLIKGTDLHAGDIVLKPESWGWHGGKWRLLDFGLGRGQMKRAALFKQF